MKKIVFAVIILLITVLVIIGLLVCALVFAPWLWTEHTLKDISNESSNTPYYALYGDLHIADEVVHISQILRKQNKEYSLKEIFCVADGKAYFVYSQRSEAARNWIVASIDLETEAIEESCCFADSKAIYQAAFHKPYNERNGFYYNGQIILSDFEKVLVFDLHSKKAEHFSYDDYIFPMQNIRGETVDAETVDIQIGDNHHRFTLDQIAETSDGIAQIYALKNKKNWEGVSLLPRFFGTGSIQADDDDIYVIGSFMDYYGSSYMVVLEYDVQDNQWLYVTHAFSGSLVHGSCKIVPDVYGTTD